MEGGACALEERAFGLKRCAVGAFCLEVRLGGRRLRLGGEGVWLKEVRRGGGAFCLEVRLGGWRSSAWEERAFGRAGRFA